MKFLLMLFADEKVGASFPPEEMAKAMDQMFAYQQTLERAGAFVATAALMPTWDARTIGLDDGQIKLHDGPYADTREQFGGYFISDAPCAGDLSGRRPGYRECRRCARRRAGARSKSGPTVRNSRHEDLHGALYRLGYVG